MRPRSRLVLASSSKHRAELLRRLELDFEVADPEFDEREHDRLFEQLGAETFALRMARGKGESLRGAHPEAWILAADQLAVCDGKLLTKPGSADAAVEQLMSLAGRAHELITGVVLLDPATDAKHEAVDRQRLTMRSFGRAAAQRYITKFAPLECCGSYRIEDAGIQFFERIEGGDYTGIIGLPLLAVSGLLREAGLLTD
jgi:septum formation protein